MAKVIEYCVHSRRHNDQFIGWAVSKVHLGCADVCCPKEIAQFYGKGAKTLALAVKKILDKRLK